MCSAKTVRSSLQPVSCSTILPPEPDAPIEVKTWFELFGPRSVWQRRLRELRIV